MSKINKHKNSKIVPQKDYCTTHITFTTVDAHLSDAKTYEIPMMLKNLKKIVSCSVRHPLGSGTTQSPA